VSLATLSIDLVAQLASLQQGMDKAGRLAERNAAQIEARYAKLSQVAAGVGAALAASFSAAGIVAFVRATVDGVDRLNDLADATGASIENLSALEDIGARTGHSIDTVGDAVIKLNKVLGDAKPGSDIARQLEGIGLSVSELQRVDPAEALRRFAVALSGFADDGNKARMVQDLLGKSAGQLAPFLRDLADAGALNGKVTAEQAAEADKFNKMLASIDKNVTDAARALSGPLVQALNSTIEKFREGEREGKTFFERYWRWVKDVYGIEQKDADPLSPLVERLRELDSLLNTNRRLTLFSGQATELEAERKTLQAQVDAIRAGRLTSGAGGGRGFVNPAPTVPTLLAGGDPKPEKPPYTTRAMEPAGLSDNALAALRAIQQTDFAKIAEINAALDELFAMRAGGLGEDAGINAAIEKLRDDLEALSPSARKAAEEKKRLDSILAQTPSGVLSDVLVDIELINAAFDRGAIDAEQWAAAIRASAAKLPQDFEKPLAEVSEFARQAGANIQDAIGDTLLASMEGKFDSLDDLWKNLIKRMIAQAAAAQLGKYLLGNDFGTTGNVGGAVGQFFNWLGTLSGKAGGGPVQAGRPYIVGERRAELFVPQQSGTIVPDLGMLGGNTTNIYVQGDVSERNVKLIQRAIANERARSMRSV
jgi:hypothetical protein